MDVLYVGRRCLTRSWQNSSVIVRLVIVRSVTVQFCISSAAIPAANKNRDGMNAAYSVLYSGSQGLRAINNRPLN